jgi:exportin-7
MSDAEENDNNKPSKLADEHELFACQLAVLLHMIVFGDHTNQWSLSRPLLVLILICEEAYSAWKEQAIQALAPHPSRQQKLAHAFEKMMIDVPRGKLANLDVKTRDRFTQNLSQFRADCRSCF